MPACESSTLFCLNAISALSNGQGVCVDNESALAVSDGDCTCFIPVKDVEQIATSCGIADVTGIVPKNTPLFAEFGRIALATEIRKYGPILNKDRMALSKSAEDSLIANAYDMGWTAEKVKYLATQFLQTPDSHFSIVARNDLQGGICIADLPAKINIAMTSLDTYFKLNLVTVVSHADLTMSALQWTVEHEQIHSRLNADMWPVIKAAVTVNYGPSQTEITPDQFIWLLSYFTAQSLFDNDKLQLPYDGFKELLPDISLTLSDFESIPPFSFKDWGSGYLNNPNIPPLIMTLVLEMHIYGVHAKVNDLAKRTLASRGDSYLETYDMNDPDYGMIVFAFAAVCHKLSGEKMESWKPFALWERSIRQAAGKKDLHSVDLALGEAITFLLWKEIFERAANSLDEKAVAELLGITK